MSEGFRAEGLRLRREQDELAVWCAGSQGPRVLLVQGTGTVGASWQAQVAGLAGDHQVVWFDHRGIGASGQLRGQVSVEAMAGDCVAVLDAMGWQTAHVVGHSLGGIVAQEVARQEPRRVLSLGLISTAWAGRSVFFGMGPRGPGLSLRMKIGPEAARWRAFAAMALSRASLARLGETRRSRCCGPRSVSLLATPPIVRRHVAALLRHRGGSMAALETIPTLILTGAEDLIVDTRLSEVLARKIPGARLERAAGAGHAIVLELPELVNTRLREHFAAAEVRLAIRG
ncbi:MAG: alpha/beta fold hydrolase [Nannocystis sp.]|nr:alpha/beta fold hydrolase [Nannocystis sp.]